MSEAEGRALLQWRGLLAGPRTLVPFASEAARALVIHPTSEEVGRRAITLAPGELTVLRW
jgi:hypothetical protein